MLPHLTSTLLNRVAVIELQYFIKTVGIRDWLLGQP